MIQLFLIITIALSSLQLQAETLSRRDAAKKEFLDASQEEFSKQSPIKKIESDENLLFLDSKSQMIALVAQLAENNTSSELKVETNNNQQKKLDILSDDSDDFRFKLKSLFVAIGLEEDKNAKLAKITQVMIQEREQKNIAHEDKIFDLDSVTDQIVYLINRIQESFTRWTTAYCDGDNANYIMGVGNQYNSTISGNNNALYKQLNNVEEDGRLCKQFVFLDENGNYSATSTKILIPCDGLGYKDGQYAAHFKNAFNGTFVLDSVLNKKVTAFYQRMDTEFDNFCRRSRQQANYGDPEKNKFNYVCALRASNVITQEQFTEYCRYTKYVKDLEVATKAMIQLYKKEHPGWTRGYINYWRGEKTLPYTDRECVEYALIIQQAIQLDPKNINEIVSYQSEKITKAEIKKAEVQAPSTSQTTTNQTSTPLLLPITQAEQKIIADIPEVPTSPTKPITQEAVTVNAPVNQAAQEAVKPDNKDVDNRAKTVAKVKSFVAQARKAVTSFKEIPAAQSAGNNDGQIDGKKGALNSSPIDIKVPDQQTTIEHIGNREIKPIEIKYSLDLDKAPGYAKMLEEKRVASLPIDIKQPIQKTSIENMSNEERKTAVIASVFDINKTKTAMADLGAKRAAQKAENNENKKNEGSAQEAKPGESQVAKPGNTQEAKPAVPEVKPPTPRAKPTAPEIKDEPSYPPSSYYLPARSYPSYSQPAASQLSFLGNQRNQQRREYESIPGLRPKNEPTTWDLVVDSYQKEAAKAHDQQMQRRKQEQARAALEWYITKKITEAALLNSHGYEYQPSEKYLVEQIKNQLILESARHSYTTMSYYDYWCSNKPKELTKIIKDSDGAIYSYESVIKSKRDGWTKESLQEIKNKEQARLAQERADKLKAEQAEAARRKSAFEALSSYGYVFKSSSQVNQKLQNVQQELQNTTTELKKDLTIYAYCFNNPRAALTKKIESLKQSEKLVQAEIEQEHQAWQKKSIDEVATLQAVKAKEQQKLEDEKDELLERAIFERQEALGNVSLPAAVKKIDDRVDIKKITKHVSIEDDFKHSQELVKDSDHRYNISATVAQDIRNHLIDEDNQYSNKVSSADMSKIDSMLNSMKHAGNNMTVEYAQTGLQAWQDAQNATTDEEYSFYRDKFEQCHRSMSKQLQSIQKGAKPVDKVELDTMLQGYNKVIQQNKKATLSNPQQANNPFIDRFEKRAQAITESKEQLCTNKLVNCDFKMSSQARGYLMANNLNYAAFDSMVATNIQHCLTRENLELIEFVTDMAQRNGYKPENKELIKQICDQAITAQQLNQRSRIEQAAAVTDLNYISAYFAQFTIDEDPELMFFILTGKGIGKATYKWGNFLYNLGTDRGVTLGKLAADTAAVGKCLGYAAAELYEQSPYAYRNDAMLDLIDDVKEFLTDGTISSRERRAAIRDKRNKEAIENVQTAAMNAALNVVSDMQKKSFEENITDISEAIFDAYLTGKAIDAVVYASTIIGKDLVNIADKFKKIVPPAVVDEYVVIMQTSTGELIAVTEKTGKDLSIVAANQIVVNRAVKVTRGKEITRDVQQFTKADTFKIAKFNAKFEKYYKSDVLLPGLEKIEGVKQIENYRVITKNFTTIADITEADVMYLNMCNGLHTHSVEINELVKKALLQVVDQNGKIIEIKKFDIFHSYLCEMRPGATSYAKKGGHLLFPESKAFTHTVGEIIPLENGYFDLYVKHVADTTGKFVPKTQFPLGSTPMENAQVIIDLIQEIKIPSYISTDSKGMTTCEFLKQCGQKFAIYVEDGVATYHPISPYAPSRGI